jgi:hypothetical protein
MTRHIDRRLLLKSGAAASAAVGLGNLGFLSQLSPVSADEAKLDPKVVQLDSGIEPLVQLIENTPRESLIEEVGNRVKKGLSYQEVLAALFLAGVRNIAPRPSVGFKFHAVLVVNSAHIASLASPDEHRWLPLFWALDSFKSAQARDVQEVNWTMAPVNESAMPSPSKARQAFLDAMEKWDEQAADVAVAQLARTAGLNDIYEMFFRLGSRDLRSIGHKAIYVANSYRTLQAIGSQHAEPVLRSLAYALLMHDGRNPSQSDEESDRPYRNNRELAKKIRPEWLDGKPDEAATKSLLEMVRTRSADEACNEVVEMLNRGVSPQSIWDGLFVAAGELLMRQPQIVPLHAVTTSNAVHFAYKTTADDDTRRLLLLQNTAFVTMFRDAAKRRGNLADRSIDNLKAEMPEGSGDAAIREVFETLGDNAPAAANKAMALLNEGKAHELIDAARVLVFLKGNDSHDYKFSSAVLEDYEHVSAPWRNTYLASNLFNLRHTKERDSSLVKRTQDALRV